MTEDMAHEIETEKFLEFCDSFVKNNVFKLFVAIQKDGSVLAGCGEKDDPLIEFKLSRKTAEFNGLTSPDNIPPSDIKKLIEESCAQILYRIQQSDSLADRKRRLVGLSGEMTFQEFLEKAKKYITPKQRAE